MTNAVDERIEVGGANSALRGGVWLAPDSGVLRDDPSLSLGFFSERYLTRSHLRGDFVFRSSDAADGFYLVLSGRVKVTLPDPIRGERLIAVCVEGDLFGSAACGGAPRALSGTQLDARVRHQG